VKQAPAVANSDRLVRHSGYARLLHWLMAIAVLILLLTSLLPIAGIKFSWVTIHWVTGMLLTLAVLIHIFWSLLGPGRLRNMLFGPVDLKDLLATLAWFFRLSRRAPALPGKYSPAQKLLHHGVALIVIAAIVTGLMMLTKIDTPLWKRDPYWLSNAAWGVIYVIHDLAAMLLVTTIMLHVYFAFRPEKRLYLRSMLLGWITRNEFASHHDSDRWEKQ
jgi:cytochrome b subunit of formate dehydrogenase